MWHFKISPPWDSNEGYISKCVLRKRDINLISKSIDKLDHMCSWQMLNFTIFVYCSSVKIMKWLKNAENLQLFYLTSIKKDITQILGLHTSYMVKIWMYTRKRLWLTFGFFLVSLSQIGCFVWNMYSVEIVEKTHIGRF